MVISFKPVNRLKPSSGEQNKIEILSEFFEEIHCYTKNFGEYNEQIIG